MVLIGLNGVLHLLSTARKYGHLVIAKYIQWICISMSNTQETSSKRSKYCSSLASSSVSCACAESGCAMWNYHPIIDLTEGIFLCMMGLHSLCRKKLSSEMKPCIAVLQVSCRINHFANIHIYLFS